MVISLALVALGGRQALESPKRQQTAKSTPASRFRNREAMGDRKIPVVKRVPQKSSDEAQESTLRIAEESNK